MRMSAPKTGLPDGVGQLLVGVFQSEPMQIMGISVMP
jgi:hypothetical protein